MSVAYFITREGIIVVQADLKSFQALGGSILADGKVLGKKVLDDAVLLIHGGKDAKKLVEAWQEAFERNALGLFKVFGATAFSVAAYDATIISTGGNHILATTMAEIADQTYRRAFDALTVIGSEAGRAFYELTYDESAASQDPVYLLGFVTEPTVGGNNIAKILSASGNSRRYSILQPRELPSLKCSSIM